MKEVRNLLLDHEFIEKLRGVDVALHVSQFLARAQGFTPFISDRVVINDHYPVGIHYMVEVGFIDSQDPGNSLLTHNFVMDLGRAHQWVAAIRAYGETGAIPSDHFILILCACAQRLMVSS